jgi:hypothetical protein
MIFLEIMDDVLLACEDACDEPPADLQDEKEIFEFPFTSLAGPFILHQDQYSCCHPQSPLKETTLLYTSWEALALCSKSLQLHEDQGQQQQILGLSAFHLVDWG